MNARQMDKLIAHFDKCFEQNEPMVFHPDGETKPHIDMLVYEPTEKYPFWKLVTMGASDYKMPPLQNSLGNRNEYMLFVDSEVDIYNKETAFWYYRKLLKVAAFPYLSKNHITYSHSFEWKYMEPDDEVVGAYLEFPQAIETTEILRCKLGWFKTVICLQVILLNKELQEKLGEFGPMEFGDYLYPEDGSYPNAICTYLKN